MTEKELRRLSRADLLELLIDQSKTLRRVQKKLRNAEAVLQDREIAVDNAGSIAEAALQLNGVFDAAQASCEQYMENIRMLSERQEKVCRLREKESVKKAAALLAETEARCAAMEAETKRKCAAMLEKAKVDSAAGREEMPPKREKVRPKHAEVREKISIFPKITGKKR